MNEVFVTGSSYDEALQQALDRFQLPESALDIQRIQGLGELIDDRGKPEETSGVTLRIVVRKEPIADSARDKLQQLLQHMGIQAEINSTVSDDTIELKMHCADSALLIGRNGQTLDAIQHLVNRMATSAGVGAPFIVLDVEDYRERHAERLERLAKRCAREAIQNREEIALEPMPRRDRKIIHMILKDSRGVKTYSRGEEGERCVVIAPSA